MKVIVKTTGSFMLYDVSTRTYVSANRPSVMFSNHFINEHVARDVINLLGKNLPDSATDEDFADYLKDFEGNEEAAVASYMSKFGIDELGNPLMKTPTITKAETVAVVKTEKNTLKLNK